MVKNKNMKNKIKFGEYRITIDSIYAYYLSENDPNVGITITRIIDAEINNITVYYPSEIIARDKIIEYDILLLQNKIKIGQLRININSVLSYHIDYNSTEMIFLELIYNNKTTIHDVPFINKKERDNMLNYLDDLLLIDIKQESRKLKLKELNAK